VAFRIPNLMRDLFAEGAMSAAFVPAFTRYLTKRGKDAAWSLGNNVLNALVLVTALLTIAGIVFAHPLVTLYAGEYASVPGKLELTITLTRLVLPFLMLVAVAAVAMGMLNSLQYYFVPALSPAMFNVATIVGAVAFVPLMPKFGWPPITAVALAALVGGLGQVAIQWPSLRREGFQYAPIVRLSDRGLREIVLLMGPGTIGLAATQVNIFVSTLLATAEGTGAVSWLSYAFRLMYLPIGLFGVSIGTAVLPAVSQHLASDDVASVRGTVSRGLGMMLMLNVPATVGLVVLARPIVELLFEHGRFTPADTIATSDALRLYALGLIGYSTARIIAPAFYALRQSRVAIGVSVLAMATNVVLSLVLVGLLGFRGLALSTSIAALVNGAMLVLLIRHRLNGIDGARLTTVVVKISVAALMMGVAASGIDIGLTTLAPGVSTVLRALRLAAAIAGAMVVLVATARWLRVDELDDALAAVGARLPRVVRFGSR
jgi:putative peptidoglycan lipid II flippase